MSPGMDQRVKVAPFAGTGFNNWKFRMETVLDTFDLLDCVHREIAEIDELREMNGDTADVKAEKKRKMVERRAAEKKCRSMLVDAIADCQLELVKGCATPKQIWDMLRESFELRSIAGQLLIRKQLLSLKYVEGVGVSLPEHLLQFDRLIRELKESGAAVEDSDAICHLLLTLPPSFDPVVTAIETLPDGVTMAFVKKRLLDVDLKMNQLAPVAENDGVAMTARHYWRKLQCYRCGKFGHKQDTCRVSVVPNQRNDDNVKNSYRKTNSVVEEERITDRTDVCFLAKDKEEELVKAQWFLDSGATNHMVNDRRLFSSLRRLKRPVEVLVANGKNMLAEFCGDMVFYADVGEMKKKKKCEVKDVLFLPGLSCNLFSVSRVARSGLQVSFLGNRAEIAKNGEVMAIGNYTGKLYELDVLCKCERSEGGAKML